ncbi:E3 ubiquitin-protein ligase Midline-1-like isoform X2 [Mizuhopecten yessoensis]|uniref:E3 ubiquitin-protein ligase Midline-1-like isoform X2 n=1 Tax=Mizuhopecten yessoensis TaxID=6573 RepID=UPI000B457CE6|nr:E3 ubiquitin-protein ligase Midline-1-like isoform X2 [Mizuhopecten yessoensis]
MDESLLSCPICLDIFRDPVNLPCAHTYCRPCLNDLASRKCPDPQRSPWQSNLTDQERYQQQKRRVLECPECRQVGVLDEKGVAGLPKNYLIATIVQKFAPDQKYPEPLVPCDACESVPPRNAVRSCTQCQTSYCKFCCEELHPRRGALAKHELFDPRERDIDEHLFPTKVLNDLFCEKCQVVLRREAELAVASHKGMGHTLVGIRQAVSQQMTSLKASILDMEVVKRELAKQEAEVSKLREINREIERIGKVIQDRQTKLRAETKLGFTGYFIKTETELDRARQKLVQATGLIGEGQALLEVNGHGTQSELVTNMIALQRRMEQTKDKLEFTFSEDQKVSQLPATADAAIRRIQNALTDTTAGQIDGIIRDSMGGGDMLEEKVQIPVVGRRWGENGASVVLEWSHGDGRVFDIQLQCDVGTERSTREIYGVCDTGVVVTRLWHDTTYRVSVWVQGRPGTKGFVDVTTLPAITSDVVFDAKKASKEIVVDSDGMRLLGKGAGNDVKFQELNCPTIAGTFGLRELTGAYNYWELKVKYRMGHLLKTAHEWAFDLGICCAHKVGYGDGTGRTYTTHTSYTCRAVKYGKKFVRLEFGVNGRMNLMPAKDLEWSNDDFYLHFGFFLNLKTRTFSVLDSANNCILYTFNDIKVAKSCLPMFSVSKKKNTIQEMSLGVRSQTTVPHVIYEKLV